MFRRLELVCISAPCGTARPSQTLLSACPAAACLSAPDAARAIENVLSKEPVQAARNHLYLTRLMLCAPQSTDSLWGLRPCACKSRRCHNVTKHHEQTECSSREVQQRYLPFEFAPRISCYGATLCCTLRPGLPNHRAIKSQYLSLCDSIQMFSQPPWDVIGIKHDMAC